MSERKRSLVVVGDDGSAQAGAAVRWAAGHASATGALLELVHVVHVPVVAGLGWRRDASLEADRLLRATRLYGRTLVDRRSRAVRLDHPALPVETTVVDGDPGMTLTRCGRSADLIVVGSRGRGAVESLLLGSVSRYVARHAECPVVVFEEAEEPTAGVLLLSQVGDDPAAATFAITYAGTHGLSLCICRESGSSGPRSRSDDDRRAVDAQITAFRARYPELAFRLDEIDTMDLEQVADETDAQLVVVERRPGRLLHDPAIVVAERCRRPVAVVPARRT